MRCAEFRSALGCTKQFLRGHRNARQAWNYWRFVFSRQRAVLGYRPLYLSFSITDRCTLRCRMCLTHGAMRRENTYSHCARNVDMDFDDFRRVVDANRQAVTAFLIGVGEPMLHPRFFDMAEYLAARKIYVHATSNGTTIADNQKKLLRSKVDMLTVSVNSATGADYERMTGHSSATFEQICHSVASLVERRNESHSALQIGASFIVDQQNCAHMQVMIDLAAQLRVDTALLHGFLPSPGEEFSPERRCLFDDDQALQNEVAKLRVPDGLRVTLPTPLSRDGSPTYCDTYFRTLRVDGAMDIGGCPIQLLNLTGNGKFDQADPWNGEYFQEMRSICLDPDGKLPSPCRWCTCSVKTVTEPSA